MPQPWRAVRPGIKMNGPDIVKSLAPSRQQAQGSRQSNTRGMGFPARPGTSAHTIRRMGFPARPGTVAQDGRTWKSVLRDRRTGRTDLEVRPPGTPYTFPAERDGTCPIWRERGRTHCYDCPRHRPVVRVSRTTAPCPKGVRRSAFGGPAGGRNGAASTIGGVACALRRKIHARILGIRLHLVYHRAVATDADCHAHTPDCITPAALSHPLLVISKP
jgi:hypothetical protein